MAKPLTVDGIEKVIDDAANAVAEVMAITHEARVLGNAMRRAFRACFIAGQDNGQAIILERSEDADSSAASLAQQAGNATLGIMSWVGAVPGRSFTGVAELPGVSSGRFVAGIMRSESDKEGSGDAFWSEYCYGESFVEALVKMAQWCREQSAKRDTLPAPPPAQSDSKIEVSAPVSQ